MAPTPKQPYQPPLLYYPINRYRWVNEWEWTDTSRKYRGGIFAGWRHGTQLWDEDLNNSFEWLQWWAPRWAHYRRDLYPFKAPPLYRVSIWVEIQDPKHTSDIATGWTDTVLYRVSGATYPLLPEIGFETYVYADRMAVFYDGSEWRPKALLVEKDRTVEIHVFMDTPKKGAIGATHTVSQPFMIPRTSKNSRMGGWKYQWSPIEIRKNGVVVGHMRKYMYSAAAEMLADTYFEAGDVMQFFIPPVNGQPQGVSMSIMGEAL